MDHNSSPRTAFVENSHDAETNALNYSRPLTPQLKIQPASGLPNKTLPVLDSSDPAPTATSPTLDFPGSYPYSPTSLEPGPSFEEIKDTARQYIQVASQFVPSHEDVRKMAHSAGHTVRGYFPNGVSTCLGPANPTQEATPTSPIEESETTPHSGEGFVLINRGKKIAIDEAHNNSEPQLTPGSKPTQVLSEFPGLTRTKLLILDPKYSRNSNSSSQNDQASEDASLKVLPGSRAESTRYHDSAPTPYSYTAKPVISRSSSISGTPTGNNHVDRQTLEPLNDDEDVNPEERPAGVVNHGDYDIVLGQGGEGSVTAPNAGMASGPGPGPGITGLTFLRAGKEKSTDFRREDSGSAVVEDDGPKREPGPEWPNVIEKIVGRSESTSEVKGVEKEIRQLKADVSHMKNERGSEKAAVRDDEQMEPGGKTDEGTSTKVVKRSLEKENTGNIKRLSPQVGSSTATDGRETSSASKFNEALPSQAGEKQKGVLTNDNPRPQSPTASADIPDVDQANLEDNTRKLAAPSSAAGENGVKSSEGQRGGSRKKRGFVQRLKTWSKKLGQNRKGQN